MSYKTMIMAGSIRAINGVKIITRRTRNGGYSVTERIRECPECGAKAINFKCTAQCGRNGI